MGMYIAFQSTQSIIMEQNAIDPMSQQLETNSNQNVVNQTDNEQYSDRTQIPSPSHYSSSRQTSEFFGSVYHVFGAG